MRDVFADAFWPEAQARLSRDAAAAVLSIHRAAPWLGRRPRAAEEIVPEPEASAAQADGVASRATGTCA